MDEIWTRYGERKYGPPATEVDPCTCGHAWVDANLKLRSHGRLHAKNEIPPPCVHMQPCMGFWHCPLGSCTYTRSRPILRGGLQLKACTLFWDCGSSKIAVNADAGARRVPRPGFGVYVSHVS